MARIQIQTFLDDICDVYQLDTAGNPKRIFRHIPLEYRTVGSRRAFDAVQAGHSISELIRIPNLGVDFHDLYITIRGQQYQVIQSQRIMDVCPACLQLTLEKPDISWALDGG